MEALTGTWVADGGEALQEVTLKVESVLTEADTALEPVGGGLAGTKGCGTVDPGGMTWPASLLVFLGLGALNRRRRTSCR